MKKRINPKRSPNRKLNPNSHRVKPVRKQITRRTNAISEQTRQIDHRPEIRKMSIKKKHQNPITLAIKQKKRRRRRFKLLGPRLHFELHADVPGKKLKTSLPTISEVVWQQSQDPPKRDPPYNTTTKDFNIQTITTTDHAQET